MRAFVVLLAVIGATALPAGASAARYSPPGNAGIQQYLDPFPTSSGDVAAPDSGTAGPGSTGQPGSLPGGLRHRLAAQGAAGAAVARLIVNTTAGRHRAGPGSRRRRGSIRPGTAPLRLAAAPRGTLSQVLDAAVTGAGSGAAGVVLPLVLVGVVAVVAIGAVRRRRRAG